MSASIPARRLHRAVADLASEQQHADALAAMPALPTTPADLARVGAVAQQEPALVTRGRR